MLGRVAGRPAAIVTFLDGMWIRRPNAGHCAAVGEALANLHLDGATFRSSGRTRCRSRAGGRCSSTPARAATACGQACRRDRARARRARALMAARPAEGVIHADLFPDNVFFLGDKLSA